MKNKIVATMISIHNGRIFVSFGRLSDDGLVHFGNSYYSFQTREKLERLFNVQRAIAERVGVA